METQIVDVMDLAQGDKIKFLGGTYEVVLIQSIFYDARRLDLDEIGGSNYLELFDIETGTTFERIIPDPEEFRVRSISDPEDFFLEFETSEINPGEVVIYPTTGGASKGAMSVDIADLKAVVEKF